VSARPVEQHDDEEQPAAPTMNEIIDARTGPPTKCASFALTPACSGRNEPATIAKRSSSRPVTSGE
jgi:hypothetical protein